MPFFEQQKKVRSLSRQLVVAYLLTLSVTVVLTGLAINVAVGYLDYEFGAKKHVIPDIFSGAYLWLFWGSGLSMASVIVFVAIGIGRSLKRHGGDSVAYWLRAAELLSGNLSPEARRLRNVVEEIAIASGVSVPRLFIVPDDSINALTAGFSTRDACIFVNRGCLERLSRDELQALIGHEFGHIRSGDTTFNMRLVGPLAGLSSLVAFGQALYRQSSGKNNKATPLAITMPLSVPLCTVGFLGEYCARWIKHHILRQREYLADAHAVQFTRDPDALLSLIAKIETQTTTSIKGSARHLTFMMFADPAGQEKRLSSHPSNLNRAKKIRPGFLASQFRFGTFAGAQKSLSDETGISTERAQHSSSVNESPPNSVAPIPAAQVQKNEAPIKAIREAAHDATLAETVLYVLMATCPDADPEHALMPQLEEHEAAMLKLMESAKAINQSHRLPLASIAMHTLVDNTPQRCPRVLDTVRQLVEAGETLSLFEFTLGVYIIQMLETDSERKFNPASRKVNLHQARRHVIALLSVVCSFGHASHVAARHAFNRGLSLALPGLAATYRPDTHWKQSLSGALDELVSLDELSREMLVEALLAACQHDGNIADEENELIGLICAVLGQPLPATLMPDAQDNE